MSSRDDACVFWADPLGSFRQEIFATVADRDGHDWGWNSAFELLEEELAAA